MANKIEMFYQNRKKYRGAHIIGLSIFLLAWIARSIYKLSGTDMENIHLFIFIILLLSLLYMAYNAIRLNIVERKIKADINLREALHDELFKLNELKSWKFAFFTIIVFIAIISILSFFIKFEDLMLIFVTTFIIGFGSYSLTLHILDR